MTIKTHTVPSSTALNFLFGDLLPADKIAREWALEIYEQMTDDDISAYEDNRAEWKDGISMMEWPEELRADSDNLDLVMCHIDALIF